jgi:hypothetical protein
MPLHRHNSPTGSADLATRTPRPLARPLALTRKKRPGPLELEDHPLGRRRAKAGGARHTTPFHSMRLMRLACPAAEASTVQGRTATRAATRWRRSARSRSFRKEAAAPDPARSRDGGRPGSRGEDRAAWLRSTTRICRLQCPRGPRGPLGRGRLRRGRCGKGWDHLNHPLLKEPGPARSPGVLEHFNGW